MDREPEPPPSGGAKPHVVRVTSIQQYESPDAAEDHRMADQRSADRTTTEDASTTPHRDPARGTARVPSATNSGTPEVARGSAPVPGGWPLLPQPDPVRATARVRPAVPSGAEGSRPAITDIQTTSGVPATPIPTALPAATAPAEPAADEDTDVGALAQAEALLAEMEADARAAGGGSASADIGPEAQVEVEVEGEPGVAAAPAIWQVDSAGQTTAVARAEVRDPAEAGDDIVPVSAEAGEEPAPDAELVGEAEIDAEVEIDAAEAEVGAEVPAGEVEEIEDWPADDSAAAPVPTGSTVAAPPADPETVIIPAYLPGEHETQVIPRIPGEQTKRIIPGEEHTRRIPVLPGPGVQTVTIPVAARLEQPPQPVFERRRQTRGGPYDLGHAPAVLMLSSLGVLLVALAYTGGREGTTGATIAYWIGQVVVFTPVVLRLLSRRMAGVAESFLLVMGLAVNQYLLKWMYSPDQFRFPDELQHWLATTTIMETGELFQPNRALPPAVHFPGLAELGAAMASMTGLPVSGAGILVAGVAHLIFVGVLFVCVLRASNSPAVAGVACATYATALHYLFFSSMFLYQTAALPFFMLAIWATRRWREEGGWPFISTALISIAMTTVSHHVTAFALIATLLLLGITELFTDRPRRWDALTMPAVALGVVAAWILLVARDVLDYLEAPIDQVWTTVSMLMTDRADASAVSAPVSIGQLALQATGLIGLFVLFVAVARDMVVRRDRDSWRWAAVVGGLIFFAGNGVRFLGQNGPEIAGRLSTFTYVPISIIAAIALVRAVQILPSRDEDGRRWWVAPALVAPPPTGRNLMVRVLAGSALVTLLMIGARAGGWPPLGSLLPGPYLAGGFERSVDAYGVDAAEWERDTLGPGNRVGGDVTSVSLASTYGRQDPVREVGPLYYATTWGLAEDNLVEQLHLNYLVVDRRLGSQLPQSDAYFENDPRAGRITEPLSVTQLAKFDTLTDVDRLYDNGTVRIYRMGAGR